jgi:hypothetical protein
MHFDVLGLALTDFLGKDFVINSLRRFRTHNEFHKETKLKIIIDEIKFQLKQDHDYYHYSLVNQTIHLLSGFLNIFSIVLIFTGSFEKGISLFLFSWLARQLGHFFLESKEFDTILNKTFQEKENEKVGANLERKRIMIAGLILSAIVFAFSPSTLVEFANTLGHDTDSAFSALMFSTLVVFLLAWVLRTLWLIVFHSPLRGISWFLKIIYDPINDIVLYRKSPVKLIHSITGSRGQ